MNRYVFLLSAVCAVAGLCDRCNAVTLHLLPVGDPGNAVDGRPGAHLGAVAYRYYLDQYDVTNAQYVEFLNAKASQVDPFGLFDERMTTSDNGGIARSAAAPSNYVVKPGMANKPVVFVSWLDALRFTNWLTNGQGIGDTETGSYLIANGGPNTGIVTVPTTTERAAWATTSSLHYLLPSADEWHKAAFYKGGGTNAGYWNYPFATNAPPISGPPGTVRGANVAKFPNTAVPGPIFLTDVGAYQYPGPYGHMDMGGNVSQYTDAHDPFDPSLIVHEGGSFAGEADATDFQGGGGTAQEAAAWDLGFRIAMVPEPGTIALFFTAMLVLLAARTRSSVRGRST